jgi:hypothetical protein
MRIFLLFCLLFSSQVFAKANYTCNIRLSLLELKLDGEFSELIVKDAQTRQVVYLSSGVRVAHANGRTSLEFENALRDLLTLTFKTDSLIQEDPILYGLANGFTGLDHVNGSIKCLKN